ncbi:MAG: DUF2157 domain-containing protein [Leptolyngbyaceae cyanobacterium SL_5_9]|nr:DUF2157 domain-containing protein [Leptolyngbyaceae cyanobacterium SL_5_9]
MASDKFRRQLRQEAVGWLANGVIDQAQHQRLSELYEFDRLDTAARDRFIVVLVGLGSILLGLGIITFVAANWQVIPRELKVLLLLLLFVGVNALGFYLWKQPLSLPIGRERAQQRFGQGLLLLGSLILGANMALMGQIFHHSGSAYALCLIWGLGVAAMAYSLRLVSLGVLAILLMGIGYWLGIQELFSVGVLPGLGLMMQNMPIIAGVLFVPLAYRCRSRVLFGMAMIAVLSSFLVVLSDLGRLFDSAPGVVVAIAFILPPALLWSYDDEIWQRPWRRLAHLPRPKPFRAIAQTMALIYLSSLIYFMSYHYWWLGGSETAVSNQFAQLFSAGLPLLLNPNLLFLMGLTLVQWFYQISPDQRTQHWRLRQGDGVILAFLLIIAGVTLWHWSVSPIMAIATFTFNVLLFLLAAGCLREGLAEGQRRLFWGGMVLLTLQVLSRMLEYDTGLLLKSLTFLLCGVAVIAVGLWFEQYVRVLHRPTLSAASSSPAPSSSEKIS